VDYGIAVITRLISTKNLLARQIQGLMVAARFALWRPAAPYANKRLVSEKGEISKPSFY
jgi:hypothetical protein